MSLLANLPQTPTSILNLFGQVASFIRNVYGNRSIRYIAYTEQTINSSNGIVYEYWPETTEQITWTNALQNTGYMCIQWH